MLPFDRLRKGELVRQRSRGRTAGLLAGAWVALALAAAPAGAITIIGGTKADPAEFPYLVDLDICGGALITPNRVLTAAHCIPELSVGSELKVGPNAEPREAVRLGQHPQLTELIDDGRDADEILPFDAALIELDQPVTSVAPIRLAGPEDAAVMAAGVRVTTVGRGSRTFSGEGSGTLRKATVAIRSDPFCKSRFRELGRGESYFSNAMLCTTDPDGKRPFSSGCYGDSGTPLVALGADGQPVSVGIDDWGVACGTRNGDPEAYVEVPAVREYALSPNPAWRPHALERPRLSGRPRAGRVVRCLKPRYQGGPDRFRYRFSLDGEVRTMRRRSRYRIPNSAAGKRISCEVVAHSPGGEEISAPSALRTVRQSE